MAKLAIVYGIFCVVTYTWLFIDTLYYSHKKPSLSEKEIRDRISAAEYEIEKYKNSDFNKLDMLFDIKEYWEYELSKLIG